MTKPLDFQSIIMTLQHFWAEHGCLIWQPYYSQVGAGTLNPATALRVLGPEPWNVGYVEPSVRPDDGRYGENPNRMQMFYQFQVILKPDPGNPQELYLQSLEALGIDPHQHDIRFVEDNWESPAIGAWGLGWEVWLDGQEITQFTYFQQSGGQMLDPVSVEITYGLERIAMTLQGGGDFRKILWNDTITDGDLNLQGEREHSQYYFEVAEVERLRKMYDLFEAEARTCIEHGLVLPAHDYVLKCSHTFNVLDSRGAIGVTERQAFFSRMRELARLVSVAYLEQRQRLEYPLLKDEGGRQKDESSSFIPHPSSFISHPSPFILEIGTEELPAGDLDSALEQLKASVPALLDELRLTHGEVHLLGTPRRLVAYVESVSPQQPDMEQVFRGPPTTRAYDTLGQPTKAAEGFARGKGISVHDLQTRQLDGGQYVVAVVKQQGRMAPEVLAEALPGLITGIRFEKSMRWNRTNVTFSRPIRWLLAILGEQIIPFEYAGLQSGNRTRGLRFTEPEEIAVTGPADYFVTLASQGILLDPLERRKIILQQVKTLAAEVGSQITDDGAGVQALLAEVANLVEAPTALRGSFDSEHLKLPREVLVSVMKKHQRYFPVETSGANGHSSLQPYFITVANKPCEGSEPSQGYPLIVEGNEHVIRARFADADFFVRDDLKHKLEDFLPRLGTLTFQLKLGSMLDKSRRIVKLVGALAQQIGLSPQETAVAHRAAELCKADLASRMVVEMTSLQGLMGRYYALHSGEDDAVATAIFEHYLPRYTGDTVPHTKPGLVVSLADRLDTLAGLFAAGLAPSGTKDPFAQRRAAIGLAQTLITRDLDFDLRVALATAKDLLPIPMEDETQSACLDFIIERLRNYLLEQGGRYDVVDAVIAAQGHNPAHSARAVQELTTWTSRPDWHTILPAYARCVRIVRSSAFQGSDATYQVRSDNDPAETALHETLLVAEKVTQGTWQPDTFLNAFLPMIPAIDRFFDVVLVMAEDPILRENRLILLQRIADLAKGVADLSKLEGF